MTIKATNKTTVTVLLYNALHQKYNSLTAMKVLKTIMKYKEIWDEYTFGGELFN